MHRSSARDNFERKENKKATQIRVVFFYAVRDENRGIPKKICKAKIFGEEEERRRKFLPSRKTRRQKKGRGSDEHRSSASVNRERKQKARFLRLAFFVRDERTAILKEIVSRETKKRQSKFALSFFCL